jgi:hypothetical protein
MQNEYYEISKEAKIKTDYKVIVCLDSDAEFFVNLPRKYTKQDVINEYERGIIYDLDTIFSDFDVTLNNIEYSGILSDVHCDKSEMLEESYQVYMTKEEKEEFKRKIINDELYLGCLHIWIDDKVYYHKKKPCYVKN